MTNTFENDNIKDAQVCRVIDKKVETSNKVETALRAVPPSNGSYFVKCPYCHDEHQHEGEATHFTLRLSKCPFSPRLYRIVFLQI